METAGANIIELIFSANGEMIRSYSLDGVDILWDAATGERLRKVTMNTPVTDVEFTADGQLGAMACTQARIFIFKPHQEPAPREEGDLYMLGREDEEIMGVALNPDGTRLATAGQNGELKLWDMETGDQISTLFADEPALIGVDFSPDGRYLATAGADGFVNLHILSAEELMEVARSRLSRGFSDEERQTYLHLDACPVTADSQ